MGYAKTFILVAGLLALDQHAAAALDPFTEAMETMMEIQGENALVLGGGFGPDAASLLHFTTSVDASARSFSYASDVGETYLGQPIAMAGSGAFRTATSDYAYDFSGSFQGADWTASGTGAWVGDPDFNYTTTFTYKGTVYTVTGTIHMDSGSGISSHTATISGPAGGQWPGPFGPYTGSDLFLRKKWQYTIPNTPIGGIEYSSNGDQPDPPVTGGPSIGTFTTQIQAVPEPGTWAALSLAVIAFRCRRNAVDKGARSN